MQQVDQLTLPQRHVRRPLKPVTLKPAHRPGPHARKLHAAPARSQALKRAPFMQPAQRQTAQEQYDKALTIRRKRTFTILLPVFAVILFGLGMGIVLRANKTTETVKDTAEAFVASAQTQMGPPADETKPDDTTITNYSVAPDMPRFISIAKLDVMARIQPMGLKADGSLASPYNIFDAGWYDRSSKPGRNGAMLIDGHVHGPTEPGIFHKLHTLEDGDTVEIEAGDGSKYTYVVVGKETAPSGEVNMNKAMVSAQAGTPGLNLITCTGNYSTEGHYEDRLVVYTVLQ